VGVDVSAETTVFGERFPRDSASGPSVSLIIEE
jgi:hypothetical protein